MTDTVQIKKNLYPLIGSMEDLRKAFMISFFTPAGMEFSSDRKSQQWGAPINVVGIPGIGKTSANAQFIRQLVWNGKPVELVVMEPGALGDAGPGAVPVPREDSRSNTNMSLAFPPHQFVLDTGADGAPAMITIDEVTTAGPVMLNQLLTFVQQGKWGLHKLPPHVRRAALCNPQSMVESEGGGLKPAQANRFCWFEFMGPTVQESQEYAISGGEIDLPTIDVALTEARILREWGTVYPQVVAEFEGWLNSHGQYRCKMPDENSPEASGPWPSNRSVTMAMRMVTTARILGYGASFEYLLVHGTLGEEAATSFVVSRESQALPSIVEFLEGKASFQHMGARLDRTHAMIAGISAALRRTVANTDKDVEIRNRWLSKSIWPFLEEISEKCADIVVPLYTELDRRYKATYDPQALETSVRLGSMLRFRS